VYKRARDASKTVDPTMATGGPAVDLDVLMESFMTGGDNKEPVTQTIQCDVRRMIEDLLTDEPYKPRLLICILMIGDVLTSEWVVS